MSTIKRIEHADVLASEAAEASVKAGAAKTPANGEATLAVIVCRAFGCDVVFSVGWHGRGNWIIIGIGPKAEIASYAMTVLLRQCKAARAQHIKTKLKRCKPAQRTARADDFCKGWVFAVSKKVRLFARAEEDTAVIDAYKAKRFATLADLSPIEHKAKGRADDSHEGYRAGRNVTLNHGVGAVGAAQGRIGHGGV